MEVADINNANILIEYDQTADQCVTTAITYARSGFLFKAVPTSWLSHDVSVSNVYALDYL